MSSWPSSDASGALVTLTAPEVQPGQTLISSSSGYSVLELIGEGSFGIVAKCRNLATRETVAIKILKKDPDFRQDPEEEVSMMEVISVLNPDHSNVVKFFERFEHLGVTCLAFEMLDQDIYQLMQERDWIALSLNEIFPIAGQLLVALDALKGLGVLHTDIKPENIMCVNQQDQPFRVKLIDFGLAITSSKVQTGMVLQPVGYRSPEIALGLPFTEAIDVWGVGCILAFLYLADNLFPVDCEYQMMKCMVEIVGQPEDHMLRAGICTNSFFIEEVAAQHPTWRLMTPDEFTAANKIEVEEQDSSTDPLSSLDDLCNNHPKDEVAEIEDRVAFVDLLKQLLHVDGDQRISPQHALQHSFITKTLLTEPFDSRVCLTAASRFIMSVCSMKASLDRVYNSAVCKHEQKSAAGFHLRRLFSASNDNTSATVSSDGSKATVSFYDEEDTCAWLSEGEIPPGSNEGDSDLGSSDGEIPAGSYVQEPDIWSSDREIHPRSYEEDSDLGFSDGEIPSFSHENDQASRSSDGSNPAELSDAASVSSGQTVKRLRRFRRFLSQIAATVCCCWRPVAED